MMVENFNQDLTIAVCIDMLLEVLENKAKSPRLKQILEQYKGFQEELNQYVTEEASNIPD